MPTTVLAVPGPGLPGSAARAATAAARRGPPADRGGRALLAEDIYRRDDKLARALGLPETGGAAATAPPAQPSR